MYLRIGRYETSHLTYICSRMYRHRVLVEMTEIRQVRLVQSFVKVSSVKHIVFGLETIYMTYGMDPVITTSTKSTESPHEVQEHQHACEQY